MFSKALFKQSCKANGTMWAIISFAVCFMLACVMLISGGGNIGDVKNSVQDTIITQEIDSQMQKRALSYYSDVSDGLEKFDALFAQNVAAALASPDSSLSQEEAIASAYAASCEALQTYLAEKAADLGYAADSAEAQELSGCVMYALNPNGTFDSFYAENDEPVPESYDVSSVLVAAASGNASEYLASAARVEYRADRAFVCAPVFLAGNMTKEENTAALVSALSSYGVTREKYESFGYTYEAIRHTAKTSVASYRGRLEYELDELAQSYRNGAFETEEAYLAAVAEKKSSLASEISSSFLSALPSAVSEALEEIGKADLYTLVVGSIFYKLAGLLLPIIYLIMASNNLVAGQVDSGSMAYVLSTSVKRISVVFTQAVFLVGSLFAMCTLTTITGCVCLSIVAEDVALTYGKLILLNLGAFLVLFALSGLCFFTSCFFDRSKRSMSIGGGLSIFALVAAMLGLFGSPVLPSVVRLESLNAFNYVTVISLFDVISITSGTCAFVWKFFILLAIGIVGYVLGSARFTKKDLPL